VSYKLSRRVFSLDISSTEKLVLRALADRANDDGSSCYPSVLTLAKETSLSRKTVQTTLRSLQARGLVVIGGQSKGGRGKTPDYHLRFPKIDQKSNQETRGKGVGVTPFRKNKGRNCVPERAKLRPVKGVTASPDSVLDSIPDSGGSPGSPPLGPIHLSQDQRENGGYAAESSSSSGKATAKKNDDDSAAGAATLSPDAPDRIEVLLEKAKTILVGRGHERDYVEVALDLVEQRAVECGKTPATVQYYLASFETHLSSREECDLVRDLVEKRRARYAKFGIPLDPTTLRLTPEQEEARRSFNERHNGTTVEPDSQIESKVPDLASAPESLAQRATEDDLWRPSTYDEAIDLLQFENNELYYDAAWRLVQRFAEHRGRFSSAENRERFKERLRRLHVKKIAEDEKDSERERKRKKERARKAEIEKGVRLNRPPARLTPKQEKTRKTINQRHFKRRRVKD